MKYPEDYIGQVIQGDCLEFMKLLPDKSIDLCLTDPPYGIGVVNKQTFGGAGLCQNTQHIKSNWDKQSPNKKYFNEILRISKNQIIFGGNYFTDKLPKSEKWLVWDKKSDDNKFSDCELIWTSFKGAIKIFRFLWKGMLQEDMKHKEARHHPTQKPIPLMKWIIKNYSNENDLILDPFTGSGSTLVAAQALGRRFIGIEISEKYCEIARERLRQKPLPF